METRPVTFQFSKSLKTPSVIKKPPDSSEKLEEVDFVTSVDGNVIESTQKRKQNTPLVIPLKKPRQKPAESTEKLKHFAHHDEKDGAVDMEESLDRKAAEELLLETAEEAKEQNGSKQVDDIKVFSSTIVEGATIGEVPSLSDYENVPVEEFGKALLRGMGWKDSDAASKSGPGQHEPVVRPKGLGLGATVSGSQSAGTTESGEDLVMAPGALVVVSVGKEKGCYGQVTSLDGDGRALVKMAVSGNTSSLPEGALQLVTKKDYKRNSRVLNQDKYNEYREKQEKQHEKDRRAGDRSHGRDDHRDRTSERPVKSKSDRRSPAKPSRSGARSESGQRSDESGGGGQPRKDAVPWVRPHLRVRCIDETYKKGRFFKEKLTVVDVITTDLCVCEDAAGRLLEDVSTGQLETVVPRHRPAHVMVVRGAHRGQVGEVIDRDQRRCRAVVQLLPDRELCTLDYDDICQYTGSMDAYS